MQLSRFGHTMQKLEFDFCTGQHGLQTWGYWCGDVLLAVDRGPSNNSYKSTTVYVAPDVTMYIGHGDSAEKTQDVERFYQMVNEHKTIHWNTDFKAMRALLIPEHWGSEC